MKKLWWGKTPVDEIPRCARNDIGARGSYGVLQRSRVDEGNPRETGHVILNGAKRSEESLVGKTPVDEIPRCARNDIG